MPCLCQLGPSCTPAARAYICATALRSWAGEACNQLDCYLHLCLPVTFYLTCSVNGAHAVMTLLLQALAVRVAGREGGTAQAAPASGHPVSAEHMSASPFAAPEAQQGAGHQPGALQQAGAPQRHQDLPRKPGGDLHRVPSACHQAGHVPLSVDELAAASVLWLLPPVAEEVQGLRRAAHAS